MDRRVLWTSVPGANWRGGTCSCRYRAVGGGRRAVAVSPRRGEWSSGPPGLGAGVSVLVIDGNAQTGPVTLHVRYPAGHTVGPHKHKSDEHVTVLSGTLLLG